MTDPSEQLVPAIKSLERAVEALRNDLVRKDVYEAERKADKAEVTGITEDVREIKDTLRWLSRTLVASLVLPLISAVLVFYAVRGVGG